MQHCCCCAARHGQPSRPKLSPSPAPPCARWSWRPRHTLHPSAARGRPLSAASSCGTCGRRASAAGLAAWWARRRLQRTQQQPLACEAAVGRGPHCSAQRAGAHHCPPPPTTPTAPHRTTTHHHTAPAPKLKSSMSSLPKPARHHHTHTTPPTPPHPHHPTQTTPPTPPHLTCTQAQILHEQQVQVRIVQLQRVPPAPAAPPRPPCALQARLRGVRVGARALLIPARCALRCFCSCCAGAHGAGGGGSGAGGCGWGRATGARRPPARGHLARGGGRGRRLARRQLRCHAGHIRLGDAAWGATGPAGTGQKQAREAQRRAQRVVRLA